MIVSQPREKLWAWVNARLGTPLSEDFRCIGSVKDGCLGAAVAYNGFTGRMCFMHAAIDDPSAVDRTFVRAIFEYPLVQTGLKYVLAPVYESNHRSIEICQRCGFVEQTRLPEAASDGSDIILMVMTCDNCRFLKDRNGRQINPGSSGLH